MKPNRTLTAIIALIVIAATLAFESLAQSITSKRDNTVATNAVVVFPGIRAKNTVLTYLDATGDNADVAAQYAAGRYMTVLTAGAASTNTTLSIANTNNFGSGQGLVLVQRADGTSTAHFYGSAATGAITISAAIGTAASAGDRVWWAPYVATNAIGNATVRLAGRLWSGPGSAPLGVRVYTSAGSAVRINNATAEYLPANPTN